MEQHIGTKTRFYIQRRNRLTGEWIDGTGQCDDEGSEYRFSFRNAHTAISAANDCRQRSESWGEAREFRVVRHVTEFTIID